MFTAFSWTGVFVNYIGKLQLAGVLCEAVSHNVIFDFLVYIEDDDIRLISREAAFKLTIYHLFHDMFICPVGGRHFFFSENAVYRSRFLLGLFRVSFGGAGVFCYQYFFSFLEVHFRMKFF